MVLFGNPGNFCNAYQGRGGGERRTDWFSPSRGNKEPKSFPFSSFKLTWDLPLHPRSHKYLNLMNFTAGVDSNQSFFRGIHPYVLFGRANVDRESTVPSLAHSFVLRNESRATSCSSNSRTISNHFARGIIFFQFSKPSPSRRLVFLQPTLLPFFFSRVTFSISSIEYRCDMGKKKKKKNNQTVLPPLCVSPRIRSILSILFDDNKGRVAYKLELVWRRKEFCWVGAEGTRSMWDRKRRRLWITVPRDCTGCQAGCARALIKSRFLNNG